MAWQDTLLDASFRGVKFDVESLSDGATRDVQRHAYPYVAGEDTEDLGRAALSMTVRAVLWGHDYETRLQALLTALEQPGPGELIHPVFGSILRAQVENWRVEHSAEGRDQCTVQIQFCQDQPGAPFFVRQLPDQKAQAAKSSSLAARVAGIEAFAKRVQNLVSLKGMAVRLNTVRTTMHRVLGIVRALTRLPAGILDVLTFPRTFTSGLANGLRGLVDLRAFSSASLMPDWKGVSAALRDTVRLPTSIATGTPSASLTTRRHPGASSASDPNLPGASASDSVALAEPVPIRPEDVAMLEAVISVIVATELAEVAADVLIGEAQTSTLSPPEIEVIVNDVRDVIQDAINRNRQQYPVEVSRPITEPLKDLAKAIQDAGIAVIETRPPLVRRVVDTPGNLHLAAFGWYGDYRRAGELARLNPRLRNPNHLNPGDVLNAYQR